MVTTIKDIAKAANVSNPAVSAVLNNKTNCRVSPATREKILKLAKEMNYKPHFSGLLLRGEKTRTVALLICDKWMKFEDYMRDLLITLMSQFDQKSYACYLADITGDADTNYSKVLELISRGVHNFIFLGVPFGHTKIRELMESTNKNSIVYGDSTFLERYVLHDSAAGVTAIIKFFLSRDRNNFRMLINRANYDTIKQDGNSRFRGLMAAFPDVDQETLKSKYLIPMDDLDVEESGYLDSFAKVGYTATAKVIDSNPDIQAIFYLSDFYAIGGAKLLIERGFSIGKDILLAGFNETPAVRNYPFPISSVGHDIDKIGDMIIKESSGDNRRFGYVIPPIVHIREV
ncbi:MAG: LacI family DNA-binding transcriptional regulator [Victivallaceae bacterium]